MLQLASALGNSAQHYDNLNRYHREGQPAHWMLGKFWQIDEAIHDYALEELPPDYCVGGFRCIERLTGDIAATYLKVGPGYWCAMTDLTSTKPELMIKVIIRAMLDHHPKKVS
jgi:hypothetical protein